MGIFGDIAGGLGGFIGGIVGNGEASDDQEQAKQNILKAIAAYQGVTVPNTGNLLTESQAGPSAAGAMDPAGRNAELSAIQYMTDAAAKGGMTLADRAAEEDALGRAAMYERGQRGAITQDMAARGQLGGGAELAAKLDAVQGGANTAYKAGITSAGNAQLRALQEMQEAGTLGGQVSQQDLQKAQAEDLMSRFNASQRAGAYQNEFNDQMAKASGLAGTYTGASGYYSGDAQRIRNRDTGMGQGLGTALGSGADAYFGTYDPTKKNGSSWSSVG